MSELATYEQQSRIMTPDGAILFIGQGRVLNPAEVVMNDTTAAQAGEMVRLNGGEARVANGAFVVPRFCRVQATAPVTGWNVASSGIPTDMPQTDRVGVLRLPNTVAAGLNAIGVTQNDLAVFDTNPAKCGKGVVAGTGSLVCVQSLASGSITANSIAAQVQGSTTAGKVNAVAAVAAGAAGNLVAGGTRMGVVVTPAGTPPGSPSSSNQTTGDDNMLGILVACGTN